MLDLLEWYSGFEDMTLEELEAEERSGEDMNQLLLDCVGLSYCAFGVI